MTFWKRQNYGDSVKKKKNQGVKRGCIDRAQRVLRILRVNSSGEIALCEAMG